MLKKSTPLYSLYRCCFVLLSFILPANLCIQINLSPPPITIMIPTPTLQPAATPLPTVTPTSQPAVKLIPKPGCFLPDLIVGQHISASGSYTETERSVSTPMVCHLQRDSCGYNQLVGILDPTIVFKQEEESPYDTEDILMHPAMLTPLSRLNRLVQAEWGDDVQLRVTEIYDSLLEHDPPESEPRSRYSLHYDGRAIDLTTWPVDQNRYGRLCALAHCAGFDWVHHEGNHCHASIKAETLCNQCRE
jgi:hypothetical protein